MGDDIAEEWKKLMEDSGTVFTYDSATDDWYKPERMTIKQFREYLLR